MDLIQNIKIIKILFLILWVWIYVRQIDWIYIWQTDRFHISFALLPSPHKHSNLIEELFFMLFSIVIITMNSVRNLFLWLSVFRQFFEYWFSCQKYLISHNFYSWFSVKKQVQLKTRFSYFIMESWKYLKIDWNYLNSVRSFVRVFFMILYW